MSDTQLALHDVRGPLNDLNEKLCGEEGPLWLAAFNRFLRKENPWEQQEPTRSIPPAATVATYPTPFVRGLTWQQRIDACKFDWVDPEVWEYIDKFVGIPDENPDPLAIELDHFGKIMSSTGVESFQSQNSRTMILPARFLHLCEHHPDLQRKHPIVCTVKVCMDRHDGARALYAHEDAGRRELYLNYRVSVWYGSCRFPSSRNVSQP